MACISRRTLLAGAWAIAALRTSAVATGQRPSAHDLTTLASAYVESYDREMTALVADELYIQEQTTLPVAGQSGGRIVRELRSEVAWVRLSGLQDAFALREVHQIDGRSVESAGRLRDLLERPEHVLEAQAARLLEESAAYNLDPGSRNINFPTFPLVYLRRRYVGRSRWRLAGHDGSLILLQFRERQRPTIVRTAWGAAVRGEGRFWIDPASGRIERSYVRTVSSERAHALSDRLRSGIYDATTVFAHNEAVALWVPLTMTESFRRGQGRETVEVTGEATYSNYRRFRTDARIVPHP